MNALHFREFVENPHQEIVTGDPTIEFEEISKKPSKSITNRNLLKAEK
jgi:hypothetical protein